MATRMRMPAFKANNVNIHLASPEEVIKADRLILKNYAAKGYWQNNQTTLARNRYLRSRYRRPFVATADGQLLGTMSLLLDSAGGLPADGFDHEALAALRGPHCHIAEVTGFATDDCGRGQMALSQILISFAFQYGYYYEAVDRLVVVCSLRHAEFYQATYRFTPLGGPSLYRYVNHESRLLTLDLRWARRHLQEHYLCDADGRSFYDLLFRAPHPSLHLPAHALMRRVRDPGRTALPLANTRTSHYTMRQGP